MFDIWLLPFQEPAAGLWLLTASAFHSTNYRKYAHRYLAAFAYRFNRRFDLQGLLACHITDVARAKPAKKLVLRKHTEASFQSG